MAQYGFYFDQSRCFGCKTCEQACKDYHNLSTTVTFRNVFEYSGGTWTDNGDGTYSQNAFKYYTSVSCNHCDDPACLSNCPSGAISKDEETGLVMNDKEICIGCKTCAIVCPYTAPSIDEDAGVAMRCDTCADRRAEGMNPICVEACLSRALDFGDIEELRAKYGDADHVAPLPDKSETAPNLVIKASVRALPVGDTTGSVTNPLEIM